MLPIEAPWDPSILYDVPVEGEEDHPAPTRPVEGRMSNGSGVKDARDLLQSILGDIPLSGLQISPCIEEKPEQVVKGATSPDRESSPLEVKADERSSKGEQSIEATTDNEGDIKATDYAQEKQKEATAASMTPPRAVHKVIRRRMEGSKRYRPSIRIDHSTSRQNTRSPSVPNVQETDGGETDTTTGTTAANNAPNPLPEPLSSIVEHFGESTLSTIQTQAKENASTGHPLPQTLTDFFPSLDEVNTAVHITNTLRIHYGLDKVKVTRGNRIKIIRMVARMRERVYMNLCAELLLPLAQSAPDTDTEDDMEGPGTDGEGDGGLGKIVLAPSNIQALGKSLPKAFPKDKQSIKAALPLAMGEQAGKVVWENGVGRVVGAEGGFRGKVYDGDVHVFIDHSNILYGLLAHLYSSTSDSLPPRHLRTLSLPSLSLLLRRGRTAPPGTLHMVASSPLKQDLDPAVRCGFEVSIMKRVEIYADEVEDPTAMSLLPKPIERKVGPSLTNGGAKGEMGMGAGVGLRRYKEQGVDEILHLKILQAINARDNRVKYYPAEGAEADYQENKERQEGRGTIVLATGDAKGGQFNRDGFVGAVREALKRGWNVELWSWSDGMSRAWKDVSKREKWGSRFGIHLLDEWAEQLVEVV